MKGSEVNLIGEIDFFDVKVEVYNDPKANSCSTQCCWQMRNPNSCYTGLMYMNYETGEATYPDGAVVPKQTDKDREMLPKFIVTGSDELSEELIKEFDKYLILEYGRRNKR